MRILPVLDLMHGVVVRGIAGQRERYRPIVSALCPSSAPTDIARAFLHQFGLRDLYLADLDAITGADPAWTTYAALRALGVHLWIDAGIRTVQDGLRIAEYGTVLVGLETVTDLSVVEDLTHKLSDPLVFSLDLRDGTPLRGQSSPDHLADEVVRRGVQRLLVLDLARVGLGAGIGTEAFCASLALRHPHLEIFAGGGVRDRADLLRLRQIGVHGVLVASALHDRRLTRADLAF